MSEKNNRTTNKTSHNCTSTSVPYLQDGWLSKKPHVYYRGACPACDSWSVSAKKENHPLYRSPMYCDKCDAFRGWVTVK